MKTLNFFLIALFIISSFAACKKDKTVPATTAIQGKWFGQLGYDEELLSEDMKFAVKADNKMDILDPSDDTWMSSTTWKLDGSKFSYSVEDGGITRTYTATFDSKAVTLKDGKWTDNATPSNHGTWAVVKLP
jgi:hypothetical protein